MIFTSEKPICTLILDSTAMLSRGKYCTCAELSATTHSVQKKLKINQIPIEPSIRTRMAAKARSLPRIPGRITQKPMISAKATSNRGRKTGSSITGVRLSLKIGISTTSELIFLTVELLCAFGRSLYLLGSCGAKSEVDRESSSG